MIRTGFEPVLPPWKGGVLTTWPTDQIDNIEMGLNGLEPSTSRLSGVRSNQLSYRPIIKIWNKAGDENRTRDNSLEGCGFTTKLHPHNTTVPTGLEPAISCVTGRRDNHYTTGPV